MSTFIIILLHSSLLLSCASFSLATTDIGDETDKLSLLAFKSRLTENPQNALSSWNDSLHVCQWEGITCGRRHRRVTFLDLHSKGLGGPISPHIGNLSFLRKIEFYNNSFHGDIPQELDRLFRLERLSVGRNSLVGEIPGNISHCSDLKVLLLPFNNLVGKIPMELGSLTKLIFVSLRYNNLSGGIPSSLGNLTSLQTLEISFNNLGGSIPSTFNLLRNLTELYLNDCNLSGKFPTFLYSNLSAIEIISMAQNQLIGNFRSETVINLPKLIHFLVGGNKLSGHIPTSLFNASRLQAIDISENQFTGKVPLNVGNLQNLTDLRFRYNNFGSGKSGDLDFFTSLTNCSLLQVLALTSNNFGGTFPASIGNFSNQFEQLFLDDNQMHGTIPLEIENAQSLISLSLALNFFTDKIPTEIGKCQNLQALDLSFNQFSGQIPSSMGNISRLFWLTLSYNKLNGSIASTLENQNLQFLDLSHNLLSASFAKNPTRLPSSLITVDISYNLMSGSIPQEIGTLKNLEALNISYNKFSGEIPSTLGSCLSMEHLKLQGNLFHGPIPVSLSSLRSLRDLDLSRNNLSGEIPKELGNLSLLTYLNLSYNHLESEVPLGGVFGNSRAFSIVGNKKICGGISTLELPKCSVVKFRKHGSSLALKVVISALAILFFAALFIVIYLWKKPREKAPSESDTVELSQVSYADIHKATEGFSAINLIGIGSYGSVYKGTLRQHERLVAIKVFNLIDRGAFKSFLTECEALRELRHRNLLKILTVCSSMDFKGYEFKALVFEFMPNGSLDNWLHPGSNDESPPRSLNFYQRLTIALDIASALNYLHNDSHRPIVHCDIKPSNILLNEDMTACVGDFGLAKFLSKSSTISIGNQTNSIAVRGTIGYIPPEYGMGAEVSKEGDVYSYGILLLEMFTGKRPTDPLFIDELSLRDYCKAALPHRVLEMIDMDVFHEATKKLRPSSVNRIRECFSAIVEIGVACSTEQMGQRMDIKQVLKEMHSIKEIILSVQAMSRNK
ncbi:hypothetical protein ACHQM5_013166 [Ranunculus cassubicifolius]